MVMEALFENIRNKTITGLYRIPDEVRAANRISAPKLENYGPGPKIKKNKLKIDGFLRYNPDEVTATSLEKIRLFPKIYTTEKTTDNTQEIDEI